MPSKKQVDTVHIIGPHKENIHVAPGMLGITDGVMNSRLTRLFDEFGDDLDLMVDYYPIFKRRFDADQAAMYKKIRRLARLVGGEIKGTGA
jgi:hypothetical protein